MLALSVLKKRLKEAIPVASSYITPSQNLGGKTVRFSEVDLISEPAT